MGDNNIICDSKKECFNYPTFCNICASNVPINEVLGYFFVDKSKSRCICNFEEVE